MDSEKLVEDVARAICDERRQTNWPQAWELASDTDKERFTAEARAAVRLVVEECAKINKRKALDYRLDGHFTSAASLEDAEEQIRSLSPDAKEQW